MFQNWSSSYIFTNDNSNNTNYTYHSYYKDNNKKYEFGVKNYHNNDNNTEKIFYKNVDFNGKKKEIYGKSINNSNWNIERRINNKKYDHYEEPYHKYSKYLDVFSKSKQNLLDNDTKCKNNVVPYQTNFPYKYISELFKDSFFQ
jgi:hypothetical protein